MSVPNVLLIVLDSVRARNTSLHGHVNETTPRLSELSRRSTTYLQARSPGIHTVASHVSMFTGYEVEEHGLTEHESRLDPDETIWRELASEYGHETDCLRRTTC
ncbi:hypothetical protein BRD00_13120 [Halobacteriales archaeon QS_8_69_26]|nr:MAG: hypothetical protein BRD00_13120 [Halobacteriales archaeon QS_8_69_26]